VDSFEDEDEPEPYSFSSLVLSF